MLFQTTATFGCSKKQTQVCCGKKQTQVRNTYCNMKVLNKDGKCDMLRILHVA